MLTEVYVEALLVDEDLADQVRGAWNKGEVDDQLAWLLWRLESQQCTSYLLY